MDKGLMRKETYLLTKTCYTKHIYAALMLYTGRWAIKNMNGKFLHDMLINWLYGGIRTLLFLWWAITVEPVLKRTCIEGPPVPPLNKKFIPTKCMYVFLWLVLSQKRCDILSQKHLHYKKRWSQESASYWKTLRCKITVRSRRKDIPARLCRTLACKAS